jgi:hypothetical protein
VCGDGGVDGSLRERDGRRYETCSISRKGFSRRRNSSFPYIRGKVR